MAEGECDLSDRCGTNCALSCQAFLSCQSYNGVWLISAYGVALLVLAIASAIFLSLNNKDVGEARKTLQKRLTFHSTDDTPRDFTQTGYKFSLVGAFLMYSWITLFSLGYIYVVLTSFLVYAPGGILWFTNMPTWFQDFLQECPSGPRNWPSFMGPYCIIFTGSHILWLVLSLTWETLRVGFMTPVGNLGDDATHVLMEEVLSYDTDIRFDPDNGAFAEKVEACFRSLTKRFESNATRTVVPIQIAKDGTRSLEYTCVRYAYEGTPQGGRFRPKGIVHNTPIELHEMLENGGNTTEQAKTLQKDCGTNEITVHVPGVFEALVGEFADFTYAFNSIGTWSYLVYSAWNIGIFWLIMTISSGAYRSLGIVRPNQKKIATLAQLRGAVTLMRDGRWVQKDIADIVLGDVIRVEGNSAKLPCDGVVVQGSLVVNESMLTGEPMPIQKMPVDKSTNATVGKKNIAYSGTECMQSIGPSDGQAVMVATSIGALTTRGQLVRMVLFPTTVRFRYNDQMPIVYAIIFVYMIFLCAIYLSPLIDLGDWIAKYLMLLNTVAMCLSPMLPVSLVMGQAVAAKRLEAKQINCLQPARIPIAGKMSTIVFDKTGTITKDGMDFDSVIPVDSSGTFCNPVKIDPDNPAANPEKLQRELPAEMRYALASCHTVTTLPDGTFVGNAVEVAMVKAAGWKIAEDKVTSPTGQESLPISKKLDFDHKRMTSGVVISTLSELRVYIKGSYEKIQAISKPEAVPSDYGSLTEKSAKEGYYVLGIATKTMPISELPRLVDMTRDELEDGLSVSGLLLFRNEMKKDSPDAIRLLKEGGIRSVICTGDNALTGVSIGRECGIVTSSKVLLGQIGAEAGVIEWRDPDIDSSGKVDIFHPEFAERNLAVTQAAWRHLHSNREELEQIWKRLTVFARMKPEDKINVVKFFQSRGLIVGMSGDGGNDCGGLRAAHAGLALSDAEASMVSPFSTGRDGKSLVTMVDVVLEGRACLATNMGTFTYFMVYCFTLTTIRTILAVVSAINFGEFVWFLMDVGINIALVGAMTVSGPTDKLGAYRPTATLLGPRTIAGIVYPYISCMLFYVIAVEAVLENQEFYKITGGTFHPINDIGLPSGAWMLRGDNYASPIAMAFLFITLITTAFVNTYGGEFRFNVLYNKGMMILHAVFMFHMVFLLWAEPNRYNCVFRVNCDTAASVTSGGVPDTDSAVNYWFWSTLAFWSAGGLGDCFMGPQIKLWQINEWQEWLSSSMTDKVPVNIKISHSGGNSTTVRKQWVPEKQTTIKTPSDEWTLDTKCEPYWLEDKSTDPAWTFDPAIVNKVDLKFTESDAEEIGTSGCRGPNNCYPNSFKITLTILVFLHVVGHHVYVKYILHGPIVERLRKRRREEIELGSTLLSSHS